MEFEFEYFGRIPYGDSLGLQDRFVSAVQVDSRKVWVLGFEFEPVITLGLRGSRDEDLLKPGNIPVVSVPRGGQATLHSPGQLVIYPICNIKFQNISVKTWTGLLLRASQRVLRKNGHETRCASIGLFQGSTKVASMGLKLVGGVSTFGLAINLKNDGSLFEAIRPCGVSGQVVGNVGYQGSLEEFFQRWCIDFKAQMDEIF